MTICTFTSDSWDICLNPAPHACDVMPWRLDIFLFLRVRLHVPWSTLLVDYPVRVWRGENPLQGLAGRSGRIVTAGGDDTFSKHNTFELMFLVELS